MNISMFDFMHFPNIFKMENDYVQEDVSVKKNKESRKEQTCSLCQNHGQRIKKKGHKCDFDNQKHFDVCKPCRMTKDRRSAASKDKKNNYQKKKTFGHILNAEPSFGKKRNDQMCRKCANHGKVQSMKDHKNSCKYLNCQCADCIETEKRRYAVKYEAKAKRQKNKNQVKQENDESMSSCASSPTHSGYSSDLSTSSLQSYTSKFSQPSVNSGFFKPTSHIGHTDFKCKEENTFWDQTSSFSPSSKDSGLFEPIPFIGHSDFEFKEEKMNWELDLSSNANTTDYYTNTSSNTFQDIISSPVKNEASENFVQSCTNFTPDDNLLQTVLQGLLNNEYDIEKIYDFCSF